MAEERKKQLDDAKLLQYYETDKIKTFHVINPVSGQIFKN